MDIWFICIICVKMCFLRAPEVDACNCDSLPQQVFLILIFWSKREPFVTKCVFRSIIRSNQRTINLQDRRLVWGLSHSWHLGCCCWQVLTQHCQRHNGPECWVLVTKETSLGYTVISQGLKQISISSSSYSRPSSNFKTSTKYQHYD